MAPAQHCSSAQISQICCGQAWLLPALGSVSPQWRRPRGPFLPSLLEEVDSDSVAIGARLPAASGLILLPFITQALLAVCVEKQMFSPFRKSCETSHPGTAAQSQRLHACKVRPLEAHNGSKGCTGQAPGLPAPCLSASPSTLGFGPAPCLLPWPLRKQSAIFLAGNLSKRQCWHLPNTSPRLPSVCFSKPQISPL